MQQDHSYGIIPLMQKDTARYTIMIKLASGNHRWLPKWHGEEGESALESAIRELHEETGLHITPDQVNINDIYIDTYEFFHPKKGDTIHKTVTYYTTILPYTDVTQLSGYSEGDGEILDKKIVTLTEAINLATYDETRKILVKIYDKQKAKA